MKNLSFILVVALTVFSCTKKNSVDPVADNFAGSWKMYDTNAATLAVSVKSFDMEKIDAGSVNVRNFPNAGYIFIMPTATAADNFAAAIGAAPIQVQPLNITNKTTKGFNYTFTEYNNSSISQHTGRAVKL